MMNLKKVFLIAFLFCFTFMADINATEQEQVTTKNTRTVQGGVGYTFKQTFPDANMAKAMAEMLGKTIDSKITSEDCNVTKITIDNKGIHNLSGIEHFVGIKEFSLDNNFVSDLTPVSSLINLEDIDGYGNDIVNIKPLYKNLNLKYLSLPKNKISDVNGVEVWQDLRSISLYGNNIVNIDSISKLKNLTYLNLRSNKIVKVDNPFESINIWKAEFDENNIENISGIITLKNLTMLNISNNNIEDISPLKDISKLTYLSVQYNKITSLNGLANKPELKSLYASKNNIVDISALQGTIKLTNLDLSDNNISNASKLETLVNLQLLNLSGNSISNLSFVKNMSALSLLNITNNDISDLTPLKDLAYLSSLQASYNFIENINPLVNLKRLDYVSLDRNNISDFRNLAKLSETVDIKFYKQFIHMPRISAPKNDELSTYKIYGLDNKAVKLDLNSGFNFRYYDSISEKNGNTYLKINKNYLDTSEFTYTYEVASMGRIEAFEVNIMQPITRDRCNYYSEKDASICAYDVSIPKKHVVSYNKQGTLLGQIGGLSELKAKERTNKYTFTYDPYSPIEIKVKSHNIEEKAGTYQVIYQSPVRPEVQKTINVTVTDDEQETSKEIKIGNTTYYYQLKNNKWFNYTTIYNSSTKQIYIYNAYASNKCKSNDAISQNCARITQKVVKNLTNKKAHKIEKFLYNVKEKRTYYNKRELYKNKWITTSLIKHKYYSNYITVGTLTEYYRAKTTSKYTKIRKRTYSTKKVRKTDLIYKYKKGLKVSRVEYVFNKKGNTKGNAYLYKTSYKKGKATKTYKYKYNAKGNLSKKAKTKLRK